MKNDKNDKVEACEAKTNRATDALSASLSAQTLETKTQVSKYHSKGGHGFAAEDANNLADKIRGKQAKVVGDSNEPNGPDRIVNGVRIQSKYFQSASKTVAAAFDAHTGTYRYPRQVLEVPKDQYDHCVRLMRDRIAQGKVPGVTNPADAEKIVHRGTVTYKQARNIARAGNVDSIIFDAKTQAVTSTYAAAISFVVNFAQCRWQGVSTEEAIRASLASALSSGGATLITGLVSAQLLRTKAAAIGAVSARSGVKAISQTSVGRAAIHRLAAGSLGKAVYGGAAINHVAKLARSNVITGTIAAAVITTPDFYRAAFDRSISWRQFAKNASVNATGVATGAAGWMAGAGAGAAIGTAAGPGVGTAIGGVIGGIAGALAGGAGGSAAAKKVVDYIAEDDSKRLLAAVQAEIEALAFEYMLTEKEVPYIATEVKRTVNPAWLRRMFKETHRGPNRNRPRRFVRQQFDPRFEELARRRPKIVLPPVSQVGEEALELVELVTYDR